MRTALRSAEGCLVLAFAAAPIWSFETAQSEGDVSLFGAIRRVLSPLGHRDAFVGGTDPWEPVKWRVCILDTLVHLVRLENVFSL